MSFTRTIEVVADKKPKADARLARLHRTVDVPQADRLENVRQLAAAVRDGITHPSALLELLDVDERHFAYYRQAATILGVVFQDDAKDLQLTDLGKTLLASKEGSGEERRVFREALRQARALKPFQTYFDGEALSIETLADRLEALTGLARETALRRARTLASWRKYVLQPPPADGPHLPELTEQLQSVIALHNAKAKQLYLEWLGKMPPTEFEHLVARLLQAMGHREVRVVGGSGDFGVDVRAKEVDVWGSSSSVAVQVKRHGKPLARRHVDEFIGVLTRERLARGIMVTTATFMPDARKAAEQDGERLRLIEGAQLVDLLGKAGIGIRYGKYGELVPAASQELTS